MPGPPAAIDLVLGRVSKAVTGEGPSPSAVDHVASQDIGPLAALDLSCSSPHTDFSLAPVLKYVGLERLLVLSVAGTRLATQELATILARGTALRKLDASYCGLTSLPPTEAWAGMTRLAVLFLHRNQITRWEDLERAAAVPNLAWLTFFENPLSGQPELRGLAVQWAKKVLAVDFWVVTDDEKLGFRSGDQSRASSMTPSQAAGSRQVSATPEEAQVLGRFTARCEESLLPFRVKPPPSRLAPKELLQEAFSELLSVHVKADRCCGASVLQRAWKEYSMRLRNRRRAELQSRVTVAIQRCIRKFLWRRHTLRYLKKYLAEIEEPELLLDTKEMLTLRATKRIEVTLRCWIRRRKARQKTREAATLICRCVRGYLTRIAFQRRLLRLTEYRRIYFPEQCAWEFLALLNAARRECRLPGLPREHEFEASGLLGVRLPEPMDLPHRKAAITQLLSLRSYFLVRPCRSGRYPGHLWDGPLHRLVDEGAPPRIQQAYTIVRRRAARVDNRCRKAFLRSCALGPHPIDVRATGSAPRLGEVETDCRDLWEFGAKLGEGAFGMAFICRKRSNNKDEPQDATEHVVRMTEHPVSWWGALRAPRPVQLRMLAKEMHVLRGLQHPNVVEILDVFVDDCFAYFVMYRFPSNLSAVSMASRKFGQRGLPAYVVGEIAGQMLRAVAFLYTKQVVHRDIRAENCVVDMAQVVGTRFRVLLADLNTARRLQEGVRLKVPIGAPEYWAPEVIARFYSFEADIWSVGVVMWYLLTMYLPFADLKEAATAELYRQTGINDEQFELAEKLLAKRPELRISAAEAVQNRWLRSCAARHRQDCRQTSAEPGLAGSARLGEAVVRAMLQQPLQSGEPARTLPAAVAAPSASPPATEAKAAAAAAALDDKGTPGKNRRMKLGSHANKEPMFKAILWKVKENGNRMMVEHWFEREMWLTENGSLVYWSKREKEAIIYYTFADVRGAVLRKIPNNRSARPFAFSVHLRSTAGSEPAPGEFAAESSEMRNKWIAAFEHFSSAGRARQEMKRRADQRFMLGEKVTIRLDREIMRDDLARAAAAAAESKWRLPASAFPQWELPCTAFPQGGPGGSLAEVLATHTNGQCNVDQWWVEARCREEGILLDEATDELRGAFVTHIWPETPGCLERQLAQHPGATAGPGGPPTQVPGAAARLHRELVAHERRLHDVGPRLCRVLDQLVLRVLSPGGNYLVGIYVDAAGAKEFRLPTIALRAAGSGFETVEKHVQRLVEHEIRAQPETILVHWMGGLQEEEASRELVPSQEYPGLHDCIKKHFLIATVEKNICPCKLVAIGLPSERPFSRVLPDGGSITWMWRDADWCRAQALPIEDSFEPPLEHEGFRSLSRLNLSRSELLAALERHGVKAEYFGVGGARSISQVLEEVNRGQVLLCARPGSTPGELRRHVHMVEFKIQNADGAHLVRTVHSFAEATNSQEDYGFPRALLQPFEDEVGAARRVLRELDVLFASATVGVGPTRAVRAFDATYPGIVTIYLKRIVEVQLEEPSTRRTEGTGSALWSATRGTPRQPDVSATVTKLDEGRGLSRLLQAMLEGPESEWPPAAQEAGSPLQLFMRQARKLGSRPCNKAVGRGIWRDQTTGVRNYREAVWLSKRILCYDCESVRLAEHLMSLLLRFRGTGGDAPLVKPVPFLVELCAREVAAAVCIQAAYKAHRARAALPCSLRTAAALRRAVLCLQRAWRASLLRRRFELLEGAKLFASSIKTNVLYMEERLLLALNLVQSVNRYAPLIPERTLGFGYSSSEEKIVLIGRMSNGRTASKRFGADGAGQYAEDTKRARRVGLPTWVTGAQHEFETVRHDDESCLAGVAGLQGLFLQGLGDMQDPHIVSVCMPSLQQAARTQVKGRQEEGPSTALLVSGGNLRFVELRFRSVAQAQQRAMVLFLCTFSALHREAVPLAPKAMLQSPRLCESILRLWDVYGLNWAQGDRAAAFQLKQRYLRNMVEVVHLCGRDSWQNVARREWLGGESLRPSSSVAEADLRGTSASLQSMPLTQRAKTTPAAGPGVANPRGQAQGGARGVLPPLGAGMASPRPWLGGAVAAAGGSQSARAHHQPQSAAQSSLAWPAQAGPGQFQLPKAFGQSKALKLGLGAPPGSARRYGSVPVSRMG